ncbi:hypothetical protein EAF04_006770 [Stromatinia cepivora]|nr:hypothetical protein EAF04_006770 [Stromatinia cepivora]
MPIIKSTSVHTDTFLARRVERSGIEREPCELCLNSDRRCLVDSSESKRCAECIRNKKGRCNPGPEIMTSYESLDRQQERLRQEEEEAMAKILRLRKQQAFLRKREKEMIRRDVRTLEELDALEEKERLEKERVEKGKEISASSPAAPNSFAFDSSLDSAVLAAMESPSFWVDPGVVGERPSTSQGP